MLMKPATKWPTASAAARARTPVNAVACQVHREQEQPEEQLERGDADASDDKAIQSILAISEY